jgi:hypothetical protein
VVVNYPYHHHHYHYCTPLTSIHQTAEVGTHVLLRTGVVGDELRRTAPFSTHIYCAR